MRSLPVWTTEALSLRELIIDSGLSAVSPVRTRDSKTQKYFIVTKSVKKSVERQGCEYKSLLLSQDDLIKIHRIVS